MSGSGCDPALSSKLRLAPARRRRQGAEPAAPRPAAPADTYCVNSELWERWFFRCPPYSDSKGIDGPLTLIWWLQLWVQRPPPCSAHVRQWRRTCSHRFKHIATWTPQGFHLVTLATCSRQHAFSASVTGCKAWEEDSWVGQKSAISSRHRPYSEINGVK